LAIAAPGKVAVFPNAGADAIRQMLAGADAAMFGDQGNPDARSAGLAMRYGAMPLAPDVAAYRDYIVDLDAASQTGNGLLYQPALTYERVSTALRAAVLRRQPDVWHPMQRRLVHAAPRWATTAAQIESLWLATSQAASA
jgi:glycogen synthase